MVYILFHNILPDAIHFVLPLLLLVLHLLVNVLCHVLCQKNILIIVIYHAIDFIIVSFISVSSLSKTSIQISLFFFLKNKKAKVSHIC